ncbi:MAG: ATP synthase F1 subunit epsilon [Endomicrobiaceae bacterium]|nr:ATP synthase F1 subunit epsilon [Endomicrobiaceae bacterium]
MTKLFKLDILSPEGSVFSGEISQMTLPTETGIITILADHADIITKLSSGQVEIEHEGEMKFIAIMGGFLEVSNNVASIIADFAVRSEELDEQKIQKAKEYAEEQLNKKDKLTSAINEHDLQKAVLELKFFDKIKIKNRNRGAK